MSQSKTPELDAKIAELEAQLEELDAERLAAIAAVKARARPVMAELHKAVAQRELYLRENPTPVLGLPNAERLEALRVKAGVATVGIKVNSGGNK